VPPGVSLTSLEASPTAVVRATTTPAEFPSLWGSMLDKVWAFLREAPPGLSKDGHNVMLYEGDLPRFEVEVGVQVTGPFEAAGDVVPSLLPAGPAAMATHTGPIGQIGETHDAVASWCAEHGHTTTGRRWEVYGDPDPATGHFDVEVYWSVEGV
jgi:effector-binding domain-containing protein